MRIFSNNLVKEKYAKNSILQCCSFQTHAPLHSPLTDLFDKKNTTFLFDSMKQHCCHSQKDCKKSQGEITSFPHFSEIEIEFISAWKNPHAPRAIHIYMFCKCFSIVASFAGVRKIYFSFFCIFILNFFAVQCEWKWIYFAPTDCVLTSTKTLF